MVKPWQFATAVYYVLHCTATLTYNTNPKHFPLHCRDNGTLPGYPPHSPRCGGDVVTNDWCIRGHYIVSVPVRIFLLFFQTLCVFKVLPMVPMSFKVIPMVPLVITLVSMVMQMVPLVLLVKLPMVTLGEPPTEPFK